MGQQQLLLLTLAAIITGTAILIGINVFSESAGEANLNAVMQDVHSIASKAQGYYRTPTQLGGGGRDFTGLDAAGPPSALSSILGFPDSTANGSYVISAAGAATMTITGTGREDMNGDGNNLTVAIVVTPDSVRTPTITR